MMEMADDRDVVAEEPEERALEIGDEAVDLENGGLERLAAAEGEQLIREGRGAPGGIADLFDLFCDLAFDRRFRSRADRCSREWW